MPPKRREYKPKYYMINNPDGAFYYTTPNESDWEDFLGFAHLFEGRQIDNTWIRTDLVSLFDATQLGIFDKVFLKISDCKEVKVSTYKVKPGLSQIYALESPIDGAAKLRYSLDEGEEFEAFDINSEWVGIIYRDYQFSDDGITFAKPGFYKRSDLELVSHRSDTELELGDIDSCPICLEPILGSYIQFVNQKAGREQCNHKMHKDCFIKYVNTNLRDVWEEFKSISYTTEYVEQDSRDFKNITAEPPKQTEWRPRIFSDHIKCPYCRESPSLIKLIDPPTESESESDDEDEPVLSVSAPPVMVAEPEPEPAPAPPPLIASLRKKKNKSKRKRNKKKSKKNTMDKKRKKSKRRKSKR